jgi:epoxyqueuosine reductase
MPRPAGVPPREKNELYIEHVEEHKMISAELVREYARESGIDTVRITSAAPFLETAEIIEARCREGLIPSGFGWASEEIARCCSPASLLPQARSVIVGGLCYLVKENADGSAPGNPHGLIAPYTRSNYYREIRRRLKRCAAGLKKYLHGGQFLVASNGFLREKPLARRSGLGFYGNHGIIITPHYGSWVVLGLIITDIAMPEDSPLADSCNSCSLCRAACPTGAIVAPGVVDITRCLQHLSQHGGPIPEEYRVLWGNRLYGCALCQEACPRNTRVAAGASHPPRGLVGPSQPLMELLRLSDDELHVRFKGNQMGARWVSPAAIKKNACVALGNSGEECVAESLAMTLSHPSEVVREHAAWALGRIGGRKSREVLEKASRSDLCAGIRDHIVRILEKM